MERYNGVELDPEGAFVYYDDAQRALDAERAQLRQVEGERDTARRRVDELESREIDVVVLQGDMTDLTHANARLREALQPFAERWEYFERTKHPSGGPWPEHLEYADDEPSAIYLGQLKAAQQALAEGKK